MQKTSILVDKIATLEKSLKIERKAHAETLAQLQRARETSPPPPLQPLKPARRSKEDLVEVIAGDVHGNKLDPAAVSAFLQDLQVIQPDRVTLGGDIIDCGGFLAEHHTIGYVPEAEDSYEEDIASANQFLDSLQSVCPSSDIHYLDGNHEHRVERWVLQQKLSHHKDISLLRRTFAAEHVLRLAERGITHYRQGHVHGNCEVPGWIKFSKLFYVHRISNAQNAAAIALAKAGTNVVFFDTHRADFKPNRTPGQGLFCAWNPGCLCRFQPLYMDTKPDGWTHGYLVRFISRSGAFQMVNILIDRGVSFGDVIFSTAK